MSLMFSADEIFQMAEQIERNGAKFYRRAAEAAVDEKAKQLLTSLAEMEDDHEKTFASMRSQLTQRGKDPITSDPQGEAAAYLRAAAEGKVFDVDADPAATLTDAEPLEQILRTAIGLEKDSIVFYLGIKQMVPEELGKSKIDSIIKEEMGHITTLSNKLASLST